MKAKDLPLVSIIIPIYNTVKYIGRTIESILAQSHPNIELILVNDGSTDGSGEICDHYAQLNNKIRVLHQVNSGVSVARNNGLDVARGDYIQFIDSDDEVLSNMTEVFIKHLESTGCDLVICGFSNVGIERKDISLETRLPETRLFEVNELLFRTYKDSHIAPLVWSSCNMIFKNSILQRHKLRFDSSIVKGEDGLFTLEYLAHCSNVLVIDQVLYIHYLYDPNERVSTFSQFAPDLYELRLKYFERLLLIVENKIEEEEIKVLLQLFYDKLIAGLVRLVAYSDHYSDTEIKQRLKFVVLNKTVIRAGAVYSRIRKGDSILIPLFIRLRMVNALMYSLQRKKNNYIQKYGRASIVRSIYGVRKGES